MKLLRDKKKLTEFLILYHSAINKPTKLAEIAEELDMTEQGVSNYVNGMEEKGLMDREGRRYHPTPSGMELIRDVISDLGEFLKTVNQKIDFIEKCTAIADDDIREGQQVGLYMKNGLLHASKSESTSMGTALNDADKGHPVEIGGLQGLIDMELGKLFIFPVHMKDTGGDLDGSIEEKLKSIGFDRLAVTGEEQYGIASMLDHEPDIVFSPIESSINAAEKGLDILVLTSEREAEKVIDRVHKQNRGREEEYEIEYELISNFM